MSAPAPSAGGERTVAAVDLGSNSFHMLVARASGEQLVVVDRMREMVQLAAGLDDRDQLSAEAGERALACLQRFGQRLRGLAPENIRAVGTNTLRRADNAGAFLAEAEQALAHPIEVIAGREEARLIYLGVAHYQPPDEAQRLVVDIGGGSTELIVGRRFTPLLTESLYMGCIGMSRRHFPEGRVSRKAMRAAEVAALQELEPIQAAYRRVGWDSALGASGTFLTIERILEQKGWGRGVTPEGLGRLRDWLVELGDPAKIDVADVKPERARVLAGGAAVLIAVFDALGIERMSGSAAALREGLLHDLVGRIEHVDARESTIRSLGERYHIDIEQAARVERTALFVRAQIAAGWKLRKSRYADMLGWAARLHELGLDIAHNQYHKHGAYVLEHADLPGFSREEQTILGLMVRAHRRKFPTRLFSVLRGTLAERTARLAIILRLAVVLHRSRITAPLPAFACAVSGEALAVAFPDDWLAEHPLTEADLAEEAGFLAAAGLTLEVR